MEIQDMSTKRLQKEYDKIVEHWDRTGEVFSLSDFEDIILELESRCNQ
jgi:hypothetical protein